MPRHVIEGARTNCAIRVSGTEFEGFDGDNTCAGARVADVDTEDAIVGGEREFAGLG